MTQQPARPDLYARYLDLLKITARAPALGALAEIVAAHLQRVPFENISKLYYRKHAGLRALPGLEAYLDGIERYRFGGTCYANNYYLFLLLEHLGYEVRLCGADMANPDVHMASVVTVEGREYIVDVGYAAPFGEPLPRDLAHDYEILLGRDRYVLKPQDAQGRSRMELHRNGRLKHGYVLKPTPRRIEFFDGVVADSFADQATFMNALLLVRYSPERTIAVYNFSVIESHGAEWTIRKLDSRESFAREVEEHFGMPREVVADAITDLGELKDAWD